MSQDDELNKILDEHNNAAEAFEKARIAFEKLRNHTIQIDETEKELSKQMARAIKSMIEANNAVMKLKRKE